MKKKKINSLVAAAFAIVLVVTVPIIPDRGVSANPLPISDSTVRVHLSSYGNPSSVTMEGIGSHVIVDNGKTFSGKFTVSVSGGMIRMVSGNIIYTLDSDVTINATSNSVANLIRINGKYAYPGNFRLLVKSGGIKMINAVDYEVYTMGVLPYEMSNGSPMEALKAQAVCARTFAFTSANSRNRAAQEHDLVNTTASQVYYGFDASQKNCISAVKATSKQILATKKNGYVYTFYSASNGGHTEYPITAGVSLSNLPYLPYKSDPYDLTYALASSGYSAKMTIPKSFYAETLRTATSPVYPMLRNKLAKVGVDIKKLKGTVKVKSVVLDTPRHTNPNRMFTGADITLTVTGMDGKVRDIRLSFEAYVDSYGKKRPFLNDVLNLSNKSMFTMLALRDNGPNYTLASVRFGHAAGMSQIGAYQMANVGKTYKDILTFYYAMGTETKLYTKNWATGSNTATGAKPPAKTVPVNKKGYVNIAGGGSLNVRTGPSTSYSSIGMLKNKTAVSITGKAGGWYRIKYKGAAAYVSGAYIKIGAAKKTASSSVAFKGKVKLSKSGDVLNVRKGPGTSYKRLGTLKNGAIISVKGKSGAWYKFKYKGKTAYVLGKYIVKA